MADAMLTAGMTAPDFTLKSTSGEMLSLADFRGQPVVLVFYPADWSPTCGDQLALYNEILPEFERLNAQVIGISVDGNWCHKAYAAARNLKLPLVADFEPKGEVARVYGVYNADGMSDRALFVIDPEGVIRWSYFAARSENPGADGILTALETLAATAGVA